MMKQSVCIASKILRALMKSVSWKILALLPVGLFASSAVAGPTFLPVNYPMTIDYLIWNTQDGTVVGGTSGSISGPGNNLAFWLAVVNNNGVATFPNPTGPGTAQVDLSFVTSIKATAPSVAPAKGQFTTSTTVDIVLQFYLQLIGPPSQTLLPMFYSGVYALSGAADPQNNVTVGVNNFLQTWTCASVCSSGPFAGITNLRSGQIIPFKLGASADSVNGGPTGVAYIDPYFYLSPAEVAAGYSLVFSEFVGNTPPATVSDSAVPEPVTLSLFGTGLAGAVAMRRRKKKTA
jgi:hypothetical protein